MMFITETRTTLIGLLLLGGLSAGRAADNAAPAPSPNPAASVSTPQLPPGIKINRANQKRFRNNIEQIARRHRMDPALLHAVISVESGYNPNAVSSAGAIGMMQLMPETAAELGVADPYDPIANIDGGARYLRGLMRKFGRINIALAAYHAGQGRVRRGRNTVPDILTTRKYVISVIHHYMRYKKSGL
jgi:soluble lytic murein transglycosylase-like protein